MTVRIRPAISLDALAIVSIAAEVWPEERLDAAVVGALIGEGGRSTLVAELDGRVVGFVDGFVTSAADGSVRWEVDLLAVSPSAQGQGVGRQLVSAGVFSGAQAGAVLARGLVRAGNLASERVFDTCGFVVDHHVCELWAGEGLLPGVPSGLHVVPVRTFRYAGYWLEDVSAERLRELRPNDRRAVVGALIPTTDAAAIEAAALIGLVTAGRYRFWRRSTSG
ncbi:MAG TPA: GNAT family N-acetyltransferase [Nitrolancea sp.]|nr:GNAT family N-acetyltransferase [Nitrolancea sp.]